ncbi:MAG: tRNA pseudouridine(38-40) synthase TruA [Pseudomonadota bacterium]
MRRARPGPPAGTTRTIRIDVQYDGTDYVGWQRQARGTSIQGLLERALSKVASEKITLFGASRTDAGVHARQQVASFSLKKSRTPIEAFVKGTNSILPDDIRVHRAAEVDLGFLASGTAKEKTYRYFLSPGEDPPVFYRRYSWNIRGPIDIGAMRDAAAALVGMHDFSSFRAGRPDTKTSVRTILKAEWEVTPLGLVCFEISGTGFLKYMVRGIVGTLVETGLHRLAPEEMRRILESKDRRAAGPTAPPRGLFLWSVVF